jgi:mannose-1-phosphate guanylyltransferase
VPTDAAGRVTAFLEKTPNPVTNQINAGCYVFRRSVIDKIPAGQVVSVERETFPGLIAAAAVVMGYAEDAYWLDVGTPEAFVQGSCDVVLGELPSPALSGSPGEFLVLGDASVSGDARLSGGTTVGYRAVIQAGADVSGSVIFDGASIGSGAIVRDSIVGRDATIAGGAVLDGVVIGDGAYVGPGNELARGLRLWPGTRLEATTVRFSADA